MELNVKTLITAWLLVPAYWMICIGRNYLVARKIGLPIVIIPFSPTNPLWLIICQPIHTLLSSVGLGSLLRFGYTGWQYKEKARPYLGEKSAIIIVTPDKVWMDIADPDGLSQIWQAERKGLFERPYDSMKMLDVFGPNISTAGHEDWVRMRRATAASFNDDTNQVVWKESLRQGSQMIATWLTAGSKGVSTTAYDTRTFALNILLAAGFGRVYDFPSPSDSKDANSWGNMDYRQALKTVLEHSIAIIAIGPKTLPKFAWLSKRVAKISKALEIYQQYMIDMLDEGRSKGSKLGSQGNLLATLVRASVKEDQLSQQEVFGNMFVYTFGGHDTTAHSLAFTFLLMSIYPEVQDWIRDEIRTVFKGDDISTWDFEDLGKLKRTLAVQYEVLRLYNPLLSIVKSTRQEAVQLVLGNGKQTVTIPADLPMTLNTNAVHSHPQYWGDDALEWRPSRFINRDSNGDEQITTPSKKGVYIPWADGLRGCPGRKFSQVEHLALMASIFRSHKVKPVQERGESIEKARKRIMNVIKDSGWALNIQMFHPERASLEWKSC